MASSLELAVDSVQASQLELSTAADGHDHDGASPKSSAAAATAQENETLKMSPTKSGALKVKSNATGNSSPKKVVFDEKTTEVHITVVDRTPTAGSDGQKMPLDLKNENEDNEDEKVGLSPKPSSCDAQCSREGEDFEPDKMMQFLLSAVAMLEGADIAVLGPCLYALQKDIGLKFTDLAYLGVAQAVCSNLAAPLWGILADRGTVSRRTILIAGSVGQGAVTVSLAFVTVMVPMIFLRALNGVMLASLRPISNGVVADCTSDSKRGAMFGKVQAALVLGMLFSVLLAGPIANKDVMGIQGWRVAFVLVGSISLIVGALLFKYFKEPISHVEEPVEQTRSTGGRAIMDELKSLCGFFRIPTFCIMIMQGIFGTIPWTVMGNQMLYFKLSGLPDGESTALATGQLVIGIFGNLLGGYVADALARRFGLHGRPLNAQITVAAGIPLIYLMYAGIEPGTGDVWTYGVLIFIWGLVACWAQSGTNFPILSEIVPASSRSRVMAWECALENSVANAIGPPVVAFLSVNVYGYKFGSADSDGMDLASARALGKAMTLVIVAPSIVCFCAYSILHLTYPRDHAKIHGETAAKSSKL